MNASTNRALPDSAELLAGLPATITAPDEARPLAALISEHIPAKSQVGFLSLPKTLADYDAARARGASNTVVFANGILTSYETALSDFRWALSQGVEALAVSPTNTQASVSTPPGVRVPKRASPVGAAVVTATPATEEMKGAVLGVAPSIMQLATVSTGVAAVVFAFVRREKLYKQAGYKSMADYAAAELGVKGETYRKYAQAGDATWKHYESLAWQIIQYVCGAARGEHPLMAAALAPAGVDLPGPGIRIPPSVLSSVPAVSLLKELPRALRRTEPAEHADIIAGVAAGTFTYEELRQKGKVKTLEPVVPAGDDAPGNDTDRAAATNEDDTHGRPDVFNDVPDLEAALRHVQGANTLLGTLVRVWSENPGHDVDPMVPEVQGLAARLKAIANDLDLVTPRTVCSKCSGEGCRACRKMGWLPRVRATGPKKAAPKPRAKTLRRGPGHKKNTARRAK